MARTRHGFHTFPGTPVSFPGFTEVVDMLNFAKAIIYVNGVGAVVEVQGSPDGSTFKDLYVFDPTSVGGALGKLQFTVTDANGHAALIDPCPRWLRLAVGIADLEDAQVEGIKEIE